MRALRLAAAVLGGCAVAVGSEPAPAAVLPGTAEWAGPVDLSGITIGQWDEYLLGQIAAAHATRGERWQRRPGTAAEYTQSVEPNREHLRQRLGVVDPRLKDPTLDRLGPWTDIRAGLASIATVRWSVLDGVSGEGLLLRPNGPIRAAAVVVPDADQSPELLAGIESGLPASAQVARRLAESGVLALVPVLVDRSSTSAGDLRRGIFTNQSNREWLARQATEVGRTVMGYEVQKILAAVDWLKSPAAGLPPSVRIGVAGGGEGGLLAFYSAALDPRIDTAWVGGYFAPRERLWEEPLDRSVWGLLEEFGDAEIATLIAPRPLIVEAGGGPVWRPAELAARPAALHSAAPGKLQPTDFAAAKTEWERARTLAGPTLTADFRLVPADPTDSGFGTPAARGDFLRSLGVASAEPAELRQPALPPAAWLAARQRRTVSEIQEHLQRLARESDRVRETAFWDRLRSPTPAAWSQQVQPVRRAFAAEFVGTWPEAAGPLRPRTRLAPEYSNEHFTVYEVVLDVYSGVETWGYLLLPRGLAADERRPVVVCEHGANGLPTDTFAAAPGDRAYRIYQGYAARLAEEGFVVFAPADPNGVAGAGFGGLYRKSFLLGRSIYSLFTADHQRLLSWLRTQAFVDPARIAFYGMSYGAKAALRVVPQLDGYCLAICAGDFHDNVANLTSVRFDKNEGEMFSGSYEVMEWNAAAAFNSAEMAALIAPRPFMVEQGYSDHGETLDWIAGEYAKVQRIYFRLGIPDRTAVDYFAGAHQVHGEATFEFLRRQLRWSALSPTR